MTQTPESWRYEIQHGPDGEANYAWVYRGEEMIATMGTHHASEIVDAMNNVSERDHLQRELDALNACNLRNFELAQGKIIEVALLHETMAKHNRGVHALITEMRDADKTVEMRMRAEKAEAALKARVG